MPVTIFTPGQDTFWALIDQKGTSGWLQLVLPQDEVAWPILDDIWLALRNLIFVREQARPQPDALFERTDIGRTVARLCWDFMLELEGPDLEAAKNKVRDVICTVVCGPKNARRFTLIDLTYPLPGTPR